jgi:outer membrane protein assembly factor BamB
MNRRSLSLIAIGLIAIIVVSSVIVYELGLMRSSSPSSILWQRPIENSATALAVDDGKVFMTDDHGKILCFDSHNGELVWNSSIYFGTSNKWSPSGAYRARNIVVSGNQVYVAIENARVSSFDKDNGTFLWTFRNADFFEGIPSIIVKDCIIFAITNAVSARDAITGETLWEANPILDQFDAQLRFYSLIGGFMDGEFIYAVGRNLNLRFSESFANMHYYKINAKLGKVVWRSPLTWDGAVISWGVSTHSPLVVARTQGRIIIHVIMQGGSLVNELYCLDSTSGKELWSIDVGEVGRPLNPIVYENLFIFAQTDGYIYAVNLADGSIAWKTKVDTHNLFSYNSAFNNQVQSSSIQIDAQNQRLFWYLNVAESGPSNNYTGTLCNLNLSNGNVNWIKHLENENATFGSFRWGARLAFNDEINKIFLTKNSGLWIFDASTGDLVQSQQFDHYVYPAIVLGNKTFVAADLWLFAYA